MIYKAFQGTNLSRLGMGNMRLPTTGEGFHAPVDYAKAQEIVDFAMAGGVNYYDTAFDYHGGDSERFLGQALAKYPRESYHLATKFYVLVSEDYKAVFDEQLEKLKTDYIDFYLIHGIFDHTFQRYLDIGCIDYFIEQQKKGRIRYLGFSSHASISNFTTFVSRHQWDFVQIQLNYYDWFYGTAKEQYDILEQWGIPVIAMGPLRGGRLATLSDAADAKMKATHPDWSIASWAFRWMKRLPNVQVILNGMSTLEDAKDSVRHFADANGLSDEDEKILIEACEAFRTELRIPCTACRYCCSPCPAKIEIDKVLEIYNRFKLDGPWGIADLNNMESEGKVTDCVECGKCDENCPQSISIKEIMMELNGMLKRFSNFFGSAE